MLGQHGIQVYCSNYTSTKNNRDDWLAACITKLRRTIDIQWKDEDDESTYQTEEINVMLVVNTMPQVLSHCDPQGINPIVHFSEFALSRRPSDDMSEYEDDDLSYSDEDNE